MPEDHRFDTALQAALAIIHQFDRPELTRQARLAGVTYAVLDAIYRAEALARPAIPPLPARVVAAGQVLPPRPNRLDGGRHERAKLPAPR